MSISRAREHSTPSVPLPSVFVLTVAGNCVISEFGLPERMVRSLQGAGEAPAGNFSEHAFSGEHEGAFESTREPMEGKVGRHSPFLGSILCPGCAPCVIQTCQSSMLSSPKGLVAYVAWNVGYFLRKRHVGHKGPIFADQGVDCIVA
jgi:hypothetical protein